MSLRLDTAMVLAAGLGKRMRPITDVVPKPLVPISGRTLLDRTLDAAAAAGVRRAVVNVHHLADQIESHLASRDDMEIIISDERSGLLDSAGGIVKALPHLRGEAFLILNADTFWIEGRASNLSRMAHSWDGRAMDLLLLLVSPAHATGHVGGTDFILDAGGRLARARNDPAGLIYAGAALANPDLFTGRSPEPHSLNRYFDEAIAAGRLHGIELDGRWVTVGTPDAIAPAERAVEDAG